MTRGSQRGGMPIIELSLNRDSAKTTTVKQETLSRISEESIGFSRKCSAWRIVRSAGACGQAASKRREGLHSEVSYKRPERGRFVWPQADSGKIHLTEAQLSMLLEGINWKQPERTWPPLSVL